MNLPSCQQILLAHTDGVLTLTLNRPHKRNAMNSELVQEIMAVFGAIADDRSIRAASPVAVNGTVSSSIPCSSNIRGK